MAITLNRTDLDFLLRQVTVNYLVPDGAGGFVESNIFNYSALANAVDPSGLREVSGANNNLVGGYWDATNQIWVPGPNSTWGQSNQPFLNLSVGQADSSAPVSGPDGYNSVGTVAIPGRAVSDSDPRLISNLVASMITDPTSVLYNPAAADAATNGLPDADFAGLQFNGQDTGFVANAGVLGGGRYNQWFVSFGQFFDHGLDFVNRDPDPSATVTVNLSPNDPLYSLGADGVLGGTGANTDVTSIMLRRADVANEADAGGDGIFGTADDAYHAAGADGVLNTADDIYSKARYVNQTGLLIDQSQTYGSHQSVNALIREYTAGGAPTGRVVSGNTAVLDTPSTADDALAVGLATWADIKLNALRIGISLNDTDDLHNAPVLRVDPVGKLLFTPDGGTAWTTDSIVIGPQAADDPFMRNPDGTVMRTGQNMLIDSNPFIPVDQHIITGDGRGNENIGLTAVHHVFHEEHNGQVANIRTSIETEAATILANEGAAAADAFLAQWQTAPGVWDGERLYQAARIITESEYNHIAIDQYVGTLYGALPEFVSYSSDINPGVSLEFSQAVFRLGHSMLTETFEVTDPNTGQPLKLLDMFLNPTLYQDMIDANGNPADLVFGLTQTLGNEVDEFVTPALQQSLLGQPLDLATINIARGREVGLPSWNEFRDQLYKQYIQNTNNTNSSALAPYNNWADVFDHLKSTGTGVNLIAAYGHDTGTFDWGIDEARANYAAGIGSLADIRAAAQELYNAYLNVDAAGDPLPLPDPRHDDAVAFMEGNPTFIDGEWSFADADQGFWDIDLWIGGLAERPLFDGPLGTTFSYVILDFAQRQQDGDRFYYLFRTPMGTNLGNEIIQNQFTNLVSEHTGLTHLNGEIFIREDARYELDGATLTNVDANSDINDYFNLASHTIFDVYGEPMPASDGHIVIAGNEGHDFIIGGLGDDTIYGDAGNDTIQGSQGNDHLFGGEGDDLILDDENDDFISGGAGNDRIFAGGGALDTVFGDEGDDELHGGDGIDEVLGGTGDDMIFGDGDTDVLFGGEGNDYLDGGDSVDEMQGQEGNDWLRGGVGDDHLIGGDGNDLLEGGLGPTANDGDRLVGQGVIDFAPAGTVEDDLGFDVVSYEDVDIAITANLDTSNNNGTGGLLDTYVGIDGLVGSRFNDNLTGGGGFDLDIQTVNGVNNLLVGGAGNDILTGLGGNDIIVGDSVAVRSDFAVDAAFSATSANWKGTGDDRPIYDVEFGHFLGENGAAGTSDVAVFSGPVDGVGYLGEYITYGGYNAVRITDLNAANGDDGTDILIGVELARFAGVDVSLVNAAPVLQLNTQVIGNYREEFGTNSYTTTDSVNATIPWTDDWIETNDGGSPTGGDIEINGNRLRFDESIDGGESIARTVNLAGASSAVLTFDYEDDSLDSTENVVAEAWDGDSWEVLGTFGGTTGSGNGSFSASLTAAQIGANSAIRFRAEGDWDNGENFYIDNVNIAIATPAVTPTTNYATTFTENGTSVAIASGPGITDNGTTLISAMIVLTNWHTGDALTISGTLPAGITSAAPVLVGDDLTLTLTGNASLSAYQTAIQQVRFGSNSDNPTADARIIQVTVNDGLFSSNLATTTVNVVAVDDATNAGDDRVVTNYVNGESFSVLESMFMRDDTDPDTVLDITALSNLSSLNASLVTNPGSLTITDSNGLPGGSFTYAVGNDTANVTVVRDAVGTISGNNGDDIIVGDETASVIDGNGGADTLIGGLGNDTFDFNEMGDSGTNLATCDIIFDFEGGGVAGGDIIDLGGIGGTFSFIGTAAFGSNGTNQLRYTLDGLGNTIVQLDNDNSSDVDSSILLFGFTGTLFAGDFIL